MQTCGRFVRDVTQCWFRRDRTSYCCVIVKSPPRKYEVYAPKNGKFSFIPNSSKSERGLYALKTTQFKKIVYNFN